MINYTFKDFLITEESLAVFEDVFNIANNLQTILSNYISSEDKVPSKFLSQADKSIRAFCILKAFYVTYSQISPGYAPNGSNVFFKMSVDELMSYILDKYDIDIDTGSASNDDMDGILRKVITNAKFFYRTVRKAIEANDISSLKEFLEDVGRIREYFNNINQLQHKFSAAAKKPEDSPIGRAETEPATQNA